MKNLILSGFVLLVLSASAFAADKPADPKVEGKATDVKTAEAPKKDLAKLTPDECEALEICPNSKKPSKQVYHVENDGKTYHFCSRNCQQSYKNNASLFKTTGQAPSADTPKKEEPKKVDVAPLDKDPKKKKEGMDDGMGKMDIK